MPMRVAATIFAAVRAALLAVALLAAAVLANPVAAADPLDKLARGPAVGAPIPHTLAAPDQTGAARDFHAVKSGRGLVLLLNRSVDW